MDSDMVTSVGNCTGKLPTMTTEEVERLFAEDFTQVLFNGVKYYRLLDIVALGTEPDQVKSLWTKTQRLMTRGFSDWKLRTVEGTCEGVDGIATRSLFGDMDTCMLIIQCCPSRGVEPIRMWMIKCLIEQWHDPRNPLRDVFGTDTTLTGGVQ